MAHPIAFVTYRDNNGEVYAMNTDGSHQVNLTNDPNTEDGGGGLSWSPDGRKILYTLQAHPAFNPSLDQNLGLASILLQTAILMGVVLFLLRQWTLPFGTFILMFTVSSVLISILNDQYAFILAAVVAGLIADLLVWRLKPSLAIPVAFRVFAFVVPLVYYALYFLVLLVTKGVGWSMNLWMGSIVMAGIVGLLVPPLTHEIK